MGGWVMVYISVIVRMCVQATEHQHNIWHGYIFMRGNIYVVCIYGILS